MPSGCGHPGGQAAPSRRARPAVRCRVVHPASGQPHRAAGVTPVVAIPRITVALWHYDEATLTDNLRGALSSRSVIDQAIGIIIGLQRCPPETAFDVLRTVSQNRNIPLRQVAADLVATTITPPHGQ